MKPLTSCHWRLFILLPFFIPTVCHSQEVSVSAAFSKHVFSPEMERRYNALTGYHALTPDGRKEIGLTDAQKEEIRALNQQYLDFADALDTAAIAAGKPLSSTKPERIQARNEMRAKKLLVYTDEQRDRLAQVIFQKHISRRGNDINMYLDPALYPFLKLSPTQVTQLGQVVRKQNDKYLSELVDLYEKHHQRLLKQLPEELKDKAELAVGEPYLPFRHVGKSVLEGDKE